MFEQYRAPEGSDPLLSTIGGIIRLGWAQLVPSGPLFEYFKLVLVVKMKGVRLQLLKLGYFFFFPVYQVSLSSAFLKCLLLPNVFQCIQMWNLIWNPPLEPRRQCNTCGTDIMLKSSRELQCLEEQPEHWKQQYPNKVPSSGLRFRPNDTSQICHQMQPLGWLIHRLTSAVSLSLPKLRFYVSKRRIQSIPTGFRRNRCWVTGKNKRRFVWMWMCVWGDGG